LKPPKTTKKLTILPSPLKGSALDGLHYQPLFSHFEHLRKQGAFQVISDGFVTLEDGTWAFNSFS